MLPSSALLFDICIGIHFKKNFVCHYCFDYWLIRFFCQLCSVFLYDCLLLLSLAWFFLLSSFQQTIVFTSKIFFSVASFLWHSCFHSSQDSFLNLKKHFRECNWLFLCLKTLFLYIGIVSYFHQFYIHFYLFPFASSSFFCFSSLSLLSIRSDENVGNFFFLFVFNSSEYIFFSLSLQLNPENKFEPQESFFSHIFLIFC